MRSLFIRMMRALQRQLLRARIQQLQFLSRRPDLWAYDDQGQFIELRLVELRCDLFSLEQQA